MTVVYRYGVSYSGARLPNAYQQLAFDPQSQEEITPEMAIHLNSPRKTGFHLGGNSQIGGLIKYENALRVRGESLSLGPVGMDLSYPYVQVPTSASLPGLGQVQAHNGFTPAEMILQAHANTREGLEGIRSDRLHSIHLCEGKGMHRLQGQSEYHLDGHP
jgi:hypothetical protein